jgi:DnaJ domain
MDPYLTLGVERGCSRAELKSAFRARVWHAHPDRGGDQQAFIEFCSAYKQLLKEVAPGPGQRKPPRADHNSPPPSTPNPKDPPSERPPRKTDRNGRRPKSFKASWEPDLILNADVGRDGQPAPPPDPQWQPDLIVVDEMRAENRPHQPLDPNWAPDVVLLDEAAEDAAGTPDPYQSLFQQISARSNPGKAENWEVKVLRVIGILIFVGMIVWTIWFCYVAWSFEPKTAASDRSVVW